MDTLLVAFCRSLDMHAEVETFASNPLYSIMLFLVLTKSTVTLLS